MVVDVRGVWDLNSIPSWIRMNELFPYSKKLLFYTKKLREANYLTFQRYLNKSW